MVKNLPSNAGDTGDEGLNPGLGRYPRGRNGNPLQYSCLENSVDRGAWWATVHGITKCQTWLSTHTHTHTHTSIWAAITNMIEWVTYKQHKFISNSSRVWAVQHQYTSVHVMSISWFTDNCLIPVSSHGEWEREGRSALISWPNNHLKPLLPNTAIRLGVRI